MQKDENHKEKAYIIQLLCIYKYLNLGNNDYFMIQILKREGIESAMSSIFIHL